jgi:hypothetical protein
MKAIKVIGTNKKFVVTYENGYSEIFKNCDIYPYQREMDENDDD